MRVLCLSVEKGIVLDVSFSPVIHNGCWVGEAEVSDEAKLAELARHTQFVLTGEVSELVPPEYVPKKSDDDEGDDEGDEGTSVPDGWPEGFPEKAKAALEAAEWTLEDVKAASDAQLEALPGIGKVSVKAIREALV
jgi:hypothetical protein